MTGIRILLADDHRMFLEGLERLLNNHFTIVGAVEDGEALVREAQAVKPDVIVADFSMPGMTGLQAMSALREVGVHCPLVLLTMHDEPAYASAAIKEGVAGYVLKKAASSELIGAIRLAAEGGIWLSPAIAGEVVRLAQEPGEDSPVLSERQKEILELLMQGQIAKEIAAHLGISRRTVEYHKYKMMRQLGLRNTAELIRHAVREGLAD